MFRNICASCLSKRLIRPPDQVFETALLEDAGFFDPLGRHIASALCRTARSDVSLRAIRPAGRTGYFGLLGRWNCRSAGPMAVVICLAWKRSCFSRGRVDEFIHEHDGTPVARILGTSLRQTTYDSRRRFSSGSQRIFDHCRGLWHAPIRRHYKPGAFIIGPWAAATNVQRRPACRR